MDPYANTDHENQRPRCEFGKTLIAKSDCPRLGEVRLDGSLFCELHAKLLRLEAREGTLLGTLFEMDKWLDDPDNRADEVYRRRILHQRDETVEELRFNRTLIDTNRTLGP